MGMGVLDCVQRSLKDGRRGGKSGLEKRTETDIAVVTKQLCIITMKATLKKNTAYRTHKR